MISIRRYIGSQDNTKEAALEAPGSLLPVIEVLLGGIADHVVEYDATDAEQFRTGIQAIRKDIDESLPLAELLVRSGIAVRALHDYTTQATAYLAMQRQELHNMLKMLTDTVTAMGAASGENVSKLQDFEQRLKATTEIVDVRVLKLRLGDCLSEIRKEAERQKAASANAIDKLRQEMTKAREDDGGPERDGTTGLKVRESAEHALAEHCAAAAPSFVAIMTVDRIQAYNARFGRAVGDQVLRYFANAVKQRLGEGDHIFRWTGANLVAILGRATSIEQARSEVKRLVDHIPEFTVNTDSRSALLPISSRFGVFSTALPVTLLIKKVDLFTSVHSGAEPANGEMDD